MTFSDCYSLLVILYPDWFYYNRHFFLLQILQLFYCLPKTAILNSLLLIVCSVKYPSSGLTSRTSSNHCPLFLDRFYGSWPHMNLWLIIKNLSLTSVRASNLVSLPLVDPSSNSTPQIPFRKLNPNHVLLTSQKDFSYFLHQLRHQIQTHFSGHLRSSSKFPPYQNSMTPFPCTSPLFFIQQCFQLQCL